ncbi:MAG: energy transducer TonB [Candidatus Methylomirabilales bacterium]
MVGDGRATTLSLLLSVLLHLGILAALPFLQVRRMPPKDKEKMRVQYVLRIPQLAPVLDPSKPPPVPRPQKRPKPKSLPATIRPRRPQPLNRPRRQRDLTPVAELPRPQVRPVEVRVPNLPEPRHPSTQWRQATVVQQRVGDSRQEDPLAAYLARVRAAIERHKRYPHSARRAGIDGRVVLHFVILPDGRVIDPRIAERSSDGAFGNAALDTLRRASPMPPFPPGINQERLMVKVPILYELSGKQ